jgi:hypothetical protein
MRQTLKRLLLPLRRLAGSFVLDEASYASAHGCIRAAASFTAWNQVEGDYLEFGVFKGESFSEAYRAVERSRRIVARTMPPNEEFDRWFKEKPRYFAFDSFAGLPGGDVTRDADYVVGAFACSEPQFRANVASYGVDMSRVVTVAGMYDQSLVPAAKARHGLRRAAMVFIDCDLYESTVPVLDFITDLVGQGTVIMFHDWFRFKGSPLQGEQRACREWLARNPQFELIEHWREGPQAVGFLVNMKDATVASAAK